MTRQLHRRLNAAQRDTARMARAATVKYAPPRPVGKPNPLTRKENEHMPIDSPLIPLVTLAAELGEDVEQLARRLDGAVIVDNIGMRCISRDVVAAVLAEHHAEQQARHDRDERRHEQATARARERTQQLHDRIRAIQARQQITIDGDFSASALATVTAGDKQERLDASGRHLDEMLSNKGGYIYHSLREED